MVKWDSDGDTIGSHCSHVEYSDQHIGLLMQLGKRLRETRTDDEIPGKRYKTMAKILGMSEKHEPFHALAAVANATAEEGENIAKGNTPKSIYQALVKGNWRGWVEACRKEKKGWIEADTYDTIKRSDMEQGYHMY